MASEEPTAAYGRADSPVRTADQTDVAHFWSENPYVFGNRNLTPLVPQAGATVGAGIRRWGHVRMFSPWTSNVDAAAVAMLGRHGWTVPDDGCPNGEELVSRYLEERALAGG